VGSGGRSVSARDFLVFAIVKVGEIEVAVGGADLHFIERIADIGVAHLVEADGIRIVGLDGDQRDAAVLIIPGQLLDASFIELRGGTVIAGESDDENLAGSVVGEAVSLAVDTGETKIGSRGANGERRRTVFLGTRESGE